MAATGGSSNARRRARAGAGLVETGGVMGARPVADPTRRVLPLRWSLLTVPVVAIAVLGLVDVFGARSWVFISTGLGVMVVAAVVDIATAQLPDPLVLGAGVVVVAGWISTDVDAGHVAVGSALMGVPVLVVHLVSPAAMGFGDVKAAFVLGGLVGLVQATAALLALSVATATMAAVGIASGRRSVPLGPGLVVGAAVAWWWSRWSGTGG